MNVSAACLAAFMALKHFEQGGLLLAIGGMALLILLFGEVAPKTLGTIRAEGLGPGLQSPHLVCHAAADASGFSGQPPFFPVPAPVPGKASEKTAP